ncbi:MAG: peptidyl-prolyl cis-trans isomerase C [Myxococcota bacterium]|jgi:peptidyl-prolyl cis-trans isomerase C
MRFLVLLALLGACGESGTNDAGEAKPGAEERGLDAMLVAPRGDVGTVLAKVGDGVVGSREFVSAAARRIPVDGVALSTDERKQVLDALVTEEALWQEATRRGLYRDPKVRKIMVNLLLREQVYSQVKGSDFSEEDLRAYFDEHPEEFMVPEKIQVKRIFLAIDDRRSEADALKLATDLHRQIKARPDRFRDLAQEHSEDPYRRRGGDLGYVAREGKPGIPAEVVARAFDLEVGQLTEPFVAGGGANVLLLVNRRERIDRPFSQMKGSVVRKLKNTRFKQLTDTYVGEILTDVTVAIDEAAVAAIDLNRMPTNPADEQGDGSEDHEIIEGLE